MTDLAAKARRAAEWLKARDTVKFSPEIRKGTKVRWLIQALNTGVYFERTDREFIAFCEDRGWQDQYSKPPEFVEVKGVESATFDQKQELAISAHSKLEVPAHEQEADGVEWLKANGYRVDFDAEDVGQEFTVFEVYDTGKAVAFSSETDVNSLPNRQQMRMVLGGVTRGVLDAFAEARAAAVEAARGMG